MTLSAYDLSLELIRELREPIASIKRSDASLYKQLTAAGASVALTVAEATGRTGGDRLHHFRIALGSLRETGACLDVAVAFGWLVEAPLAKQRDRLCGLLYGLQR